MISLCLFIRLFQETLPSLNPPPIKLKPKLHIGGKLGTDKQPQLGTIKLSTQSEKQGRSQLNMISLSLLDPSRALKGLVFLGPLVFFQGKEGIVFIVFRFIII